MKRGYICGLEVCVFMLISQVAHCFGWEEQPLSTLFTGSPRLVRFLQLINISLEQLLIDSCRQVIYSLRREEKIKCKYWPRVVVCVRSAELVNSKKQKPLQQQQRRQYICGLGDFGGFVSNITEWLSLDIVLAVCLWINSTW